MTTNQHPAATLVDHGVRCDTISVSPVTEETSTAVIKAAALEVVPDTHSITGWTVDWFPGSGSARVTVWKD